MFTLFLKVYWKQVPAWFSFLYAEMLCVPTAVSSVSMFFQKHYWNKIASFEVLTHFKGEAGSVVFSILVFCVSILFIFCPQESTFTMS